MVRGGPWLCLKLAFRLKKVGNADPCVAHVHYICHYTAGRAASDKDLVFADI